MFHYYNVYDYKGNWVGMTDYEWTAENMAMEYCGYYEEAFDDELEYDDLFREDNDNDKNLYDKKQWQVRGFEDERCSCEGTI